MHAYNPNKAGCLGLFLYNHCSCSLHNQVVVLERSRTG